MGYYAGKHIAAQLLGRPTPEPFVYSDLGELATIGRNSAVAH
jgi:NADH dehydrogenase FAD-containing subunit